MFVRIRIIILVMAAGSALLGSHAARAQQNATPPNRIVAVSAAVGDTVSAQEKATYGIFPYYATDNFRRAYFTISLTADSTLTLHTELRDGRLVQRPFTSTEFVSTRLQIESRVRELSLPGEKVPLVDLSSITSTSNNPDFVLGAMYQVTLHNKTSFKGKLVGITSATADFDTPDLGRVTVQRADIQRYVILNVGRNGRLRDDIGNGTRLFFAPTARNLRKGEGYVQNIDVFLLGANYGITDNFSVGLLASALPGTGLSNQIVAFTPKLTTAVSTKWNVGVGALVARIPDFYNDRGFAAGIAYGLATYGTADDNLTMGLGYGFSGQGGFGQTPVVLLGGAKRVTNRVSIILENYIFAQQDGFAAGLYGTRLNWSRATLGIGSFYVAPFKGEGIFGYFYPVYLDVALRFGQPKK